MPAASPVRRMFCGNCWWTAPSTTCGISRRPFWASSSPGGSAGWACGWLCLWRRYSISSVWAGTVTMDWFPGSRCFGPFTTAFYTVRLYPQWPVLRATVPSAWGRRKAVEPKAVSGGLLPLSGSHERRGAVAPSHGCPAPRQHVPRPPPVHSMPFSLLLGGNKGESRKVREFSTAMYVLHPLCIVLVRGAAKLLGLGEMLIENSVLHFIVVLALSALLSAPCLLRLQRSPAPPLGPGGRWIWRPLGTTPRCCGTHWPRGQS